MSLFYPLMQLAVPSAVRKAVRAATMTFTAISMIFFFIIILLFTFIQLKPSLDGVLFQVYATLHAGHCLDEAGPVLLGQALVAPETGKLADVPDVALRIVLCGRRPAGDDAPDAAQLVLGGIGAQEAESGPEAPLHGGELAKGGPSPFLPRGGGRYFTFPEGLRVPDV